MRHRRRCLQKAPTTRQKACNACVQAKARCCYSHPICSRCAKRGISCVYATTASSKATDPANTTESSGQLDLWGSHSLPWSLDLDDIPMDVIDDALSSLPALPNTDSNLVSTSQHAPQQYDLLGMSDVTGFRNTTLVEHPDSSQCLRLLIQYPMLLMRDDFYCPFAHRSLFSEDVPDMTVLTQTPVAICCASGLLSKQGAHFVRRTMDAQRHSIIEAYVGICNTSTRNKTNAISPTTTAWNSGTPCMRCSCTRSWTFPRWKREIAGSHALVVLSRPHS